MTEQRVGYSNAIDPLLEQLAQQLESNPQFMACVLASHRRQEGKSLAAQREMLGVDHIGFVRLALCRRPAADPVANPATDPATFRSHVEKIARYTGSNLGPLVQLIRRVDAVESMDARTIAPEIEARATTQTVHASILRPMAAARDRLSEAPTAYTAPSAQPAPMAADHANESSHGNAEKTERPAPGRAEVSHDIARDLPPESPKNPGDALA